MRSCWKRDQKIEKAKLPFRRFQLIISYFGPAHYGWQCQNKVGDLDISVQATIERAIYKISGEKSVVYGSGRTDSGVHAIAQSAHFDNSNIKMDSESLRRAINANLPNTVRIQKVIERFDNFHARFSTLLREYIYIIKDDKSFSAFDFQRVWHIRKYPEISILNRMEKLLLGEDRDYYSFDFSKIDDGHSTKRDILEAKFEFQNDFLKFTIIGNAFLYHMVRAIVGTCVLLCQKYNEKDSLKILEEYFDDNNPNRKKISYIAPPNGLYLKRIIYSEGEYIKLLNEYERKCEK